MTTQSRGNTVQTNTQVGFSKRNREVIFDTHPDHVWFRFAKQNKYCKPRNFYTLKLELSLD